VLTGMACARGFSLSLNYRKTYQGRWRHGAPDLAVPPPHASPIAQTAARHARLGGWAAPSLLRHILEASDGFDEAVTELRAARLVAPCYILIVGCDAAQAALLTCDSGFERRVDAMRRGGALVIANLDPTDTETPPLPPPTGVGSSGKMLGRVAAKDFVQGESLLRRDLVLRRIRKAKREWSLSSPGESWDAARGVATLVRALSVPPVANAATLHSTVMVPALERFVSEHSPGPRKLAAKGYTEADALCMLCCRCAAPPACAAAGAGAGEHPEAALADGRRVGSGEGTGPGSLLRRRGGGYYCRAHLPLRQKDLSRPTTAGTASAVHRREKPDGSVN
jgi:hypothetical protein